MRQVVPPGAAVGDLCQLGYQPRRRKCQVVLPGVAAHELRQLDHPSRRRRLVLAVVRQ